MDTIRAENFKTLRMTRNAYAPKLERPFHISDVRILKSKPFWKSLFLTIVIITAMRTVEFGTDAILAFFGVLIGVLVTIALYMFTRIMKNQQDTKNDISLFRFVLIEFGTHIGADISKLLPKDK